MRTPVRGSSSSGRSRSRWRDALGGVAWLWLLTGCSVGPVRLEHGPDSAEHLEYFAQAIAAEPSRREQLWQAALQEPAGPHAALHRAMLRTVAGHSGYDPAAGETELHALLAHNPPRDVTAVARARLEDLRAINACRTEVESLKRRLSKVADIEKRLDQERR